MAQAEGMWNQEQCWEALERRDRNADGHFYVGVLTTGVYCRPSCPSRRALRKNVRFYATPHDAERDGLRACLRCHPLEIGKDPAAEKIQELCRYIEANPEAPHDLAELAARAGLSRFHLQRSFKAAVGLTPKQYADACRLRKLKHSLRESKDVAEAVYDAGFGSSSRVYERAGTRLGMTPNQYRQGGRGVAISYATAQTPVGLMMIGASDRGLCFVQFGESPDDMLKNLRKEYPSAEIAPMRTPHPAEFQQWMDALLLHLSGNRAQARIAARYSGHGISDARLELPPVHSLRRGASLQRGRRRHRPSPPPPAPSRAPAPPTRSPSPSPATASSAAPGSWAGTVGVWPANAPSSTWNAPRARPPLRIP